MTQHQIKCYNCGTNFSYYVDPPNCHVPTTHALDQTSVSGFPSCCGIVVLTGIDDKNLTPEKLTQLEEQNSSRSGAYLAALPPDGWGSYKYAEAQKTLEAHDWRQLLRFSNPWHGHNTLVLYGKVFSKEKAKH